jgi:5-methylcytosine-specific restriction endonuclease McrA
VSSLKPLLKPSKKPKPESVVKYKYKADIEFSRYVRYRDGRYSHELQGFETQCITCGAWKPLKEMQAGHFVTRANTLLRYDEENVNAQCYACNVIRHGDLYEYAKQLDIKYGAGTAEKLHQQRHATHRLTVDELKMVIERSKLGLQSKIASSK